MTAALLQALKVSVALGGAVILKQVTLSIEPGQIILVVGENGAGKSTLVKTLAGLIKPTYGEVTVCGEPFQVAPLSQRRKVGVVLHRSMLYGALTARENLEFYARLYNVSHPKQRALEWLERVNLLAHADRPVREFSHGMEQRLSLARAMLHEPDVLLLDEPYAGLDCEAAATATRLIRSVPARGGGVLVTAHSVLLDKDLPAQILTMAQGRVVSIARPGVESGKVGEPRRAV